MVSLNLPLWVRLVLLVGASGEVYASAIIRVAAPENGGSGGRDMMASVLVEAASLATRRDVSMADRLSADH